MILVHSSCDEWLSKERRDNRSGEEVSRLVFELSKGAKVLEEGDELCVRDVG